MKASDNPHCSHKTALIFLPPALPVKRKSGGPGGGSGRNAFAARAAYNFMVVDEPEEKTAAKDLQSGY